MHLGKRHFNEGNLSPEKSHNQHNFLEETPVNHNKFLDSEKNKAVFEQILDSLQTPKTHYNSQTNHRKLGLEDSSSF